MKYTLITGASSDIAISIIRKIYANGKNMILTDTKNKLTELMKKLEEIDKNILESVVVKELDFTEENVAIKFENLSNLYKVDSLINIAGINVFKKFLSWSEEEIQKVLTINSTNTILLTQYICRSMIQNTIEGNVIFISSQHGMVANYDRVPYSLSKAILIQMTKSLALELAHYKIRVNCISPSFVINNNNKEMLNSPYFILNALEKIPLGKYITPDDIAEATLFLNSKKASSITGHNLVMDGGWTVK